VAVNNPSVLPGDFSLPRKIPGAFVPDLSLQIPVPVGSTGYFGGVAAWTKATAARTTRTIMLLILSMVYSLVEGEDDDAVSTASWGEGCVGETSDAGVPVSSATSAGAGNFSCAIRRTEFSSSRW